MKLGMVFPQIETGGDPGAVRAIGDAAADLGYDYLLAYDHVVGAEHADREPPLWGPYTENDPFHDPLVMFSYLAGRHETLEFATGVIILPQRQTVLLAKQAADLDLLSGERLRLGVGVGWNYVEFEALGQDFATRGRRANEQIEFMRQLWTEPLLDWEGEFDRISRGNILPRPNRSIPIWVGGFSDAAYRRGIAHGDGFMFAGDAKRIFAAHERLLELADERGRDLEGFGLEFVKSRATNLDDALADRSRWQDLGGTHFAPSSMEMGHVTIDDHIAFYERFMAG
ncbi:MAG: LLM class F420-dependent oxidoreductase [Actinomycetota bacterium]